MIKGSTVATVGRVLVTAAVAGMAGSILFPTMFLGLPEASKLFNGPGSPEQTRLVAMLIISHGLLAGIAATWVLGWCCERRPESPTD